MTSFKALRAELQDELTTAGVPTSLDPTQPFSAPSAIALPGDPYLTTGPGAQGLTAHYRVWLLVDQTPRYVEEAEALIAKALPALLDAGYRVSDVSGIDIFSVPNGRSFVGVEMQVYDDTIDRRLIT